MIVFAPDRMAVKIDKDFAFCQEVWVKSDANGEPAWVQQVNNSITIFTRGSIHLDFFIDACQRVARSKAQLDRLDVGTRLLSRLSAAIPLPVLTNVGTFSPAIMADIVGGTENFLRTYAQHLRTPLACANLCASLLGRQFSGLAMDDRCYETVVAECLRTKGDVVNRLLAHPSDVAHGGRASD